VPEASSAFLAPLPVLPTPRQAFPHCRRHAALPLYSCASAHTTASVAAASAPTTAPALSVVAAHSQSCYDVAVIGAGPAGLSLASALASQGATVVLLDPALDAPWPNHYGVWRDEFEALGLAHCASTEYPATSVCVGGADDKTVVPRPYLRVDRVLLKQTLLDRCKQSGRVHLLPAPVTAVDHVHDAFSTLILGDGVASRQKPPLHASRNVHRAPLPQTLTARLVVDCTGHALRFTKSASPSRYVRPMEQAAYGIEADVVSHPYAVDEMLLMDFRDDHMQADPRDAAASAARPTFLYVFPTSKTRAFFEETSVIAPEAVPFDELKDRLYKRLAHDGVVVKNVVEEELSLIPMGGTTPDASQRIISFGGAACLVHPATGYMVARTIALSSKVATAIIAGLVDIGENGSVAPVSLAVWATIWSRSERRQRDFLNFGAELLGGLGARESRDFFDAFFRLRGGLWERFLGANMEAPSERAWFALSFFMIANNEIRAALLGGMISIGGWPLVRSVLPLWVGGPVFGECAEEGE
jgi:lycopene beta-cyclase